MNKIAFLCSSKTADVMGFFTGDKQQKLTLALYRAIDSHSVEHLHAAIAAGADVNGTCKFGPMLYRAVSVQFTEGVRVLLENKAYPGAHLQDGETCLMKAASLGSREIAKLLVDHGAALESKRHDGQTVLHVAAAYGRGDIVKMLLENGADPKAADNRMNLPSDLARSNYPRVAELLREREVKKPEPAAAPVAVHTDGWRLTARNEVSNVSEKAEIGYRLTEIFNFGSGIYTRIACNMSTGAESQTMRFFDEFSNHEALDRAQEALTRLGGDAPRKLDKPSLAARPQGGNP